MSGVTVDPLQLTATVGVGIATHLIFFGGNNMLANALRLGGAAKTEDGRSFHQHRLFDSCLLYAWQSWP